MSVDQFLLSATTADVNFPNVRPTLDLNFARVKALDPRITFTRSSGGSYVGADGLIKYAGVNEARFDHYPNTGESLGLLIEESRTNLLPYSEQFNISAWARLNSSLQTNATTAPDGNTTAAKLIDTTANVQHTIYYGRTASNETVTLSVFAKAAERTGVYLQLSNFASASVDVNYNLSNGTIVSVSPSSADYTNISASIVAYPNGWYRCILTATKGSVNTTNNVTISTSAPTAIYQGDGNSGIYIWGAQLEQGSFPTSYIPTTTSTVTRAADNASITGNNFSSFYNQSEGSFMLDIRNIQKQPSTGAYTRLIELRGTPEASNYYTIPIIPNSFTIYNEIQVNGISQLDFAATYPSADGKTKITIGLQQNNFGSYNLNLPFLFDTSTTLPVLNILYFGRASNGTSQLNGTIARLTYFPKRLPNAQLQALTR